MCMFSVCTPPTIKLHVTSLSGSVELDALPDSGADVSVAGRLLLEQLGKHEANLLPTSVTFRAVDMVRGTPLSWRVAKRLLSYPILIDLHPHHSGQMDLPALA